MEINVLTKSKTEVEFEIDSLTLAEILRVYLNKDNDVTFAAWKRDHIGGTPMMKVKTKSKDVKSIVDSAVKEVVKDLEKLDKDFKGMK